MKAQNQYKIDHIAQTITLTKKFAKSAGIINSPEYTLFKQLRADYPDYTIQEREIAKKEGKKSYANLTYEFMREYIIITEGEGSENIRNLETVITISKGQAGRYAYVKTWFLKKFPNYNDALATMEALA